ncbi:MAG TPA: biotin/lipoyl-containing protein [bacterium]|nr:biotin/lipoyl-containing protein [bacterium]
MKIRVGGSSVQIERIDKDRLLVDGKVLTIDAKSLESGRVEFMVEGKPLSLQVQRDQGLLKVHFGEESVSVRIETPSPRSEPEKEKLKSRMPGKVLAVKVKPGDSVSARQGLLVLEAMKMENEIQAPADATVEAVHVREGEVVGSNQPLIDLILEPGA